MAYITGSVTDSLGTLPFSLLAGTQLTMSIQNNGNAPSYFGLETIPNNNGLYVSGSTPKNLSGSFITGSGISNIVYDDYKMVAVVNPRGGTLTYTPAINISASTLWTKGTAASLQPGNFPYALTNGFSSRVIRDGGIIEDSDAIINAINSQPILKNASYLLVPSGYKAGTLYSELSTNDYSDLTWERASSGSRINSLGNIENMGFNVPRLDYTYGTDPSVLLEPRRTNIIPNSTMVGAVPGTPGTNPTFWVTDSVNEVTGTGSENGLNYIDLLISGSGGSGDVNIRFMSTQSLASNGQTFTSTFYAKIASGNTGSGGKLVSSITEMSSSGTAVNTVTSSITVSTSSLNRFTFTKTLNGGVSSQRIRTSIDYFTGGNPYNFVLRIAAPQVESGSYATTFIPTTNTSASRLVDTGSLNNIYNNGLINSNGGTWYVELNNNREYIRDAGNFPLFISNMTASGGTSTSLEFRNVTGGSLARLSLLARTASLGTTIITTTTDNLKAAFRWNGSNVTVFVTGSNAGSLAFNATNMPFLRVFGSDVPIYIKTMALFSDPLSDADCIALTTL
jgi:hypothetical protein